MIPSATNRDQSRPAVCACRFQAIAPGFRTVCRDRKGLVSEKKMLRLARSSAADCASKSIKEQLIARWIVLTSGGSSRQSPTVDDLSRAWAILNLPPGSSEEA